MLHITNGDHVGNTLIVGPLPGDVIVWRDVLHEGPVPAGLTLTELSEVRARFIHSGGWTESLADTLEGFAARDRELAESLTQDEIVLWFEHDLYDQLQLLQLLDWFAHQSLERTRLSLISRQEYLGTLNSRTLAAHFPFRESVTPAQLEVAKRAWAAFRSPDPVELTTLLTTDLSPLPFLHAALTRLLQQYPSVENGLSRTEQQALEAFRDGATSVAAAFLLGQEQDEPAAFLGDSTFAWYLTSLASSPDPLLSFADGSPFEPASDAAESLAFWQREVVLTELGAEVIAGRADRLEVRGIDRWIGGVHLQTPASIWRWDQHSATIRSGNR